MQHLYNIKSFKTNLDRSLSNFDSMSPVAIHFNESDHIISRDFSFTVFNNDLCETPKRLSVENDLIHLLLKLNSKI